MSDAQCAHCNLDTAGNHEWNCPLHSSNRPIITFTGGSTQYVYIECPDCKIKDDELQLLRSRLDIAEDTLKAIEGHEHITDPVECVAYYPRTDVLLGRREGHRCCATIASEGLKRMEEMK